MYLVKNLLVYKFIELITNQVDNEKCVLHFLKVDVLFRVVCIVMRRLTCFKGNAQVRVPFNRTTFLNVFLLLLD